MAIFFSTTLEARLKTRLRKAPLPTIGPSLIFEYPTLSELVAFLIEPDPEPNEREELQPERSSLGKAKIRVRHVVSLGTLCMTAQA